MNPRVYVPDAVKAAKGETPWPDSTAWPEPMHKAAWHGPVGELVRIIEPHTEGDPAALVVMALAAFGNIVGPGPHFLAQGRQHAARIWPILVGETAKGRKGSAWSSLRYVLAQVDAHWADNCVASGLSTGEGLIKAVCDPIIETEQTQNGPVEVVKDDGAKDKRLLVMEEEFSSVLKVSGREKNTLSDVLRRAWDGEKLRTLTKNSPDVASGAHITVCGHITKMELSKLLCKTDAFNGFGNRFLWVAVRRSKLLPEGGSLHEENLTPMIRSLRDAIGKARTLSAVHRTPEAGEFWRDLYAALSSDQPGMLGAITSRAEAQVMRMALLYAILDGRGEIACEHLKAGLAVWDYCERSARFIFGESLGDSDADRILEEIRAVWPEGKTLKELHDLFNRNASAARIKKALELLRRYGLIEKCLSDSHCGKPPESWRATYELNEQSPLYSFLS